LNADPLRDGPTLCPINGLLLILVETNQGVAQSPLVHISMVLSTQTFGLTGWTTKPTRLHMHVMHPNEWTVGKNEGIAYTPLS